MNFFFLRTSQTRTQQLPRMDVFFILLHNFFFFFTHYFILNEEENHEIETLNSCTYKIKSILLKPLASCWLHQGQSHGQTKT